MKSKHLTRVEIKQLTRQGCTAQHWNNVSVSPQCDLSRIRNVTFLGTVKVGKNDGVVSVEGRTVPCGIVNATLADCTIGDNVRIANVGSIIANYSIEDNAVVEDVASIVAEEAATFGNGVELDVVNEGGGRGTRILSELTAQTAYLQAMLKHNAVLTRNLSDLIARKAAENGGRASIGRNAIVVHCGSIRNVKVGPYAQIHGAQYLENGTVNSCAEHPSEIGEAVQAKSFILAEGARVESGVILDKVFVGQAVKLGKQFSAENSLFFANCEGFHGEAVSLFAGPYTVTHHKSTLLIAGIFSFYNAGSGTNQSNHMYKLGPVHQGVFERGCKTGSFSYLLLESHIGAFCVVIGKHYTNIDAPNLPFSYIREEDGVSRIIPGMNLFSVGTVRDGEKWPKRDNRKAPVKRDLIVFDVFSPYTVEKMRRGRDELLALSESTPKDKAFITYGGVQLNRLLLRKGAKYYSMAVARYLNDKVCGRIEQEMARTRDWGEVTAALRPERGLGRPDEWTDVGGLLTPTERLRILEEKIADGRCTSYDDLLTEFQEIYQRYRNDEWQYVYDACAKEYNIRLEAMTREQALLAAEEWRKAAVSLHTMIFEDSKREFATFAKVGYGIDGNDEQRESDFAAVRGSIETNSVVQKLVKEGNEIQQRYDHLRTVLTA